MERVTYTGDGKTPHSFREVSELNQTTIFGYNNNTDERATAQPYRAGAGGAFNLSKLPVSNTSTKRMAFTRMSYNAGPGPELTVVFVSDDPRVGTVHLGVGQYVNIDPGHKGTFSWSDGKTHPVDIQVQHGR